MRVQRASDTIRTMPPLRIVKTFQCPTPPITGCATAVRGKFTFRANKWAWKWKGGTIDPAEAGDPSGETDLALCVYTPTDGYILGGVLPHGLPEWTPIKRGFQYRDRTRSRFELEKLKIRSGTPSLGATVQAKGRVGITVPIPTTPMATPITPNGN